MSLLSIEILSNFFPITLLDEFLYESSDSDDESVDSDASTGDAEMEEMDASYHVQSLKKDKPALKDSLSLGHVSSSLSFLFFSKFCI